MALQVSEHQARQHPRARRGQAPAHGQPPFARQPDRPDSQTLINRSLLYDGCPQIAVRNCFIRGSVVRYVQLPKAAVDTQLLEDATRRGQYQSSYLSLGFAYLSNDCTGAGADAFGGSSVRREHEPKQAVDWSKLSRGKERFCTARPSGITDCTKPMTHKDLLRERRVERATLRASVC